MGVQLLGSRVVCESCKESPCQCSFGGMSRQEWAAHLLKNAAKSMVEAEYAEAEALAKLSLITDKDKVTDIEEWIANLHLATAARVQAQLHYANCRTELRMAWEARGRQ